MSRPMWAHVQGCMATSYKSSSTATLLQYAYSLKPEDISDGRIQDTSGEVIYKVVFKALVFRPFRGEILDGVVSEVSSNGIMIESGPLKSFISKLVLLSTFTIPLEN